ncbi:hypothetical protein KAURM247S_08297 [Kitasatospora aureofaciens]
MPPLPPPRPPPHPRRNRRRTVSPPGSDGCTTSEIPARIGESRMHVSRVLSATPARLRERLADRDAPGWAEESEECD